MGREASVVARRNSNTPKRDGRTWVIDFTMVVVTLMWATSIVAEIFNPDFEMASGVQEIMMLMAGSLFSARQITTRNNSKPDEEG